MSLRLTAPEVLERLHHARQILTAVSVYGEMGRYGFGDTWREGQKVLTAIGELERYAERRLHRRDVAAYAADVAAFAQFVLGELLAAAPAREV